MTKKIFAVVVAVMMVMALSIGVAATAVDIPENVAAGTSDELVVINFPEGCVYNIGDKVTVHFAGSADGDFRVWLANGQATMSPEPLWKASEQGVEAGAFDVTFEFEVADKDGVGVTTANGIIFKGPAYGTPLSNLKLTTLEIVDGNDAAAETTPEAAPETTPEAAPDVPVEATPETTPEAPKTGLALAVVPAVMALAAVAVSKKH